jgi:energy-coupling factor transporter transmembrane protein EcfT
MESSNQHTIKNKPRTVAIIFTVLLFGFIFLIFLPPIIGLEGMDGGFAVSTASLFLAISSLIVAIVYFQLAQKFKRITSGDNLIAHWRYEREEWLKFTEKEYKYEKNKNRMLLFLIGVIALVIFIVFALFNSDTWHIILMVLLGLMALLAIFAFLVPWLNYKARKKSSYELYLSKNGVYIGGSFHVWGFLGSKLKDAAFDEKEMQVILDYSYPTRTGPSNEMVHIPVPPSKIDAAREAVKKLAEII